MTATPCNEIVAAEISVLANTLRLYVESHLRFGDLMLIDREEASRNVKGLVSVSGRYRCRQRTWPIPPYRASRNVAIYVDFNWRHP